MAKPKDELTKTLRITDALHKKLLDFCEKNGNPKIYTVVENALTAYFTKSYSGNGSMKKK